jgi:hypothetical protein
MSIHRLVTGIALVVSVSVPALAQAPEGWRVRIDRSESAQDPDDTPDLQVAGTGAGFRVTSGPAGTFWNPANTARGNFSAKANFTLLKPSGHVNYYGLIFGGGEIDAAAQRYVYFLVAQNGTFIIRRRTGEKVEDVQGRTPHQAIRQPGTDGRSVNALEVRASANTIDYVVNGTVVHSTPRSALGAAADGLVGVRVNHLLDVQVDGFAVQPG